ncbi:peroxisomal membrane protein PEX14-like isoform X1 [Pyrus x bretschneideri]|uniref:peroxisomal membrane protein PEX14-like isoform X1 n=1 Tax=Pyrus x bretschneideri TaxID=225117 RepID=UPI00202FD822|nr:peroxisomal membrane protein PEX14-like isoform X1 [Pyrus x bretschneideri]
MAYKEQNPAGIAQPTTEGQQDAGDEPPRQSSTPSVFVNSEPMREEQVQNAVKFLSHPKVRGSPVVYRRSFLEKKGLTKEEIDEAFRRVPDPPSGNQADGQVKTSSNVQAQNTTQTLQPSAAAPTKAISPVGTLTGYRFHWSHAIVAVGVLTLSGCGAAVLIKKSLIPRLKAWIRKVVLEDENDVKNKVDSKPSLAEEAAAAAKTAAAAASDVAKFSQEMLNSKTEERKYFVELMSLLDVQVQEMKSMSNSIRKLEGETKASRTSLVDHEDNRIAITNSKQQYVNGKAEYDVRSVQSSSAAASMEPAPHPKSYMDIMAMVQRGEKPPNVKDIDDFPLNPNQQLSNPRLVPRAKPWEVGQAQNNPSQVLQSQVSSSLNSSIQDNGLNYQSKGDSTVSWWQQQQKNSRITEIESEVNGGSYGVRTSEQPVQRTWVPPQPPPVAMAVAAEAIRRPKPSVQKEQLGNDLPIARPSEATNGPSEAADELQRVTKIAESGGESKQINGSSPLNSTTEIQEEEVSY